MITGIELGAERKRAITAESANASAITAEITRATGAEQANADALSTLGFSVVNGQLNVTYNV